MFPLSRRTFVARLTELLAGALALPLLVRCGSKEAPGPSLVDRVQAHRNTLDCTSTKGLWEAEVKTRIDNAYIDRSVRTDQFCFICKNYEPAADAGTCASCRTVKGPIHPLGWCKSWTEKR